jgi:4-hydroxyphenylpyruvate dioxygenase
MYKHSIASVSIPGTLQEKMLAIANAGYDGIELFENDLTGSNLSPKELRSMAKDLGIEIVALQPFRDFEAMPTPLHIQNIVRAKYKLELVNTLGAKRLFVCSNTSPDTINNDDLAAEQLHELATLAQQYGVEIGYEALSWGRYVNTYQHSVAIVNKANHSNLGHILDNYHIGVVGSSLDDIYKIEGKKITIAQIADAPLIEMSPMYLGRHYRCFPGQGSYPVVEYVSALRATGYNGYLSHEIFSDDFRNGHAEAVAIDGKRSLTWVECIAIEPQAKVVINEFNFIEFKSGNRKSDVLISTLMSLGFLKTYTHEKLDLCVYQNSDIIIFISYETDIAQEPTVSSVGFRGEKLEQIKLWAKKLNYQWKNSSHGGFFSGVKSLGDLMFCFSENKIDTFFFEQNEFVPTENKLVENGIQCIDHLGHAVRPEEFHSNTLFYRTMLGLDIEQSLDLFDPNGIVNSRVVKENKLNKIRFSLSASKGKNTNIEKFKNTSKITEIQQIAFNTVDIFKTANSIIDKESILSIPSNYYADLKSKFIVDDDTISQMQMHNILVDKNNDGLFFHFYLKEINGLFFEIVQRVGQYDRYGEANAQIRLTAQSRR